MFGLAAEEDEERRRQRKLEEALEIQSLRRIISAYLNYPEAAERDVRRYERSYRKLSPSHKALLSHYPMKFQSLRRCISVNCYFIFSMLQAFEPPLDMSQETELCEESCLSKAPNDHLLPAEENVGSCHPPFLQEGNDYCNNNLVCTGDPVKESCKARVTSDEATKPDCCSESTCGSCLSVCKTSKSDYTDSTRHDWLDPSIQLDVPLVDVDKVRCIIRNIVRDWAVEGQKERDQCYKPILEELNSLFTDRHRDKPPTCLVPGAGLGRLALEISCLGFVSQGNEFSYYMMICSSFILNHSQTVGEWTIYPWIHSNCNSLSDSDQLRPVSIPDIHPASAGITDGFSMCGGDFVEVYSDPSQVGAWDAVVTCFFIDTAHNVIEYIEIISRILKDGGVWINLGPLLYHFADTYGQEDEMSVELSLEDVRRVAFHYGFQIKKETTIETTYTTNPQAMMQNRYYAAFWTMEKKSVALGDLL